MKRSRRKFSSKFKASVAIEALKEQKNLAELVSTLKSIKDISMLQKLEVSTIQLPQLLRYEDRNSMRHSIETRLPFLDYRMVELALSVKP